MNRLLLLASVLALSGLGVLTFRTSAQESFTPQAHEQPTAVELGALTETQRVHSELYEGTNGHPDTLLQQGADVPEFSCALHAFPIIYDLTFSELIRQQSDLADLVVVASVTSKSSQLTTDQKWIFTDYELTPTTVLKNNPAAPVQLGHPFVITRSGGAILLDGKEYRVTDKRFQSMESGTGQYILFLKFIAATGTYRMVDSLSTFRLTDKVDTLSDNPLPTRFEDGNPGILNSPSVFLEKVRLNVIAHPLASEPPLGIVTQ